MPTALAKSKNLLPAILTQDKITELIERVDERVAPHVSKQIELGKLIARLNITDQASANKAIALRDSIKENAEKGIEIVEPIIVLANSLHKGMTGIRKNILTEQATNLDILHDKLKVWDDHVREEQAKRDLEAKQKAEAAAQAERDRLKKIADEEAEKARIAREEAAEKQRIADAAVVKAQKENTPEAAAEAQHAVVEAQAHADEAAVVQTSAVNAQVHAAKPMDTSHVKAAPVYRPTASAPSWVDNWKGRLVGGDNPGQRMQSLVAMVKFIFGVPPEQFLAHPEFLSLISANEVEINKVASVQKQGMAIPGCEAYNDKFLRGSRR